MKLTPADQKFLDLHIAPRVHESNLQAANPFSGWSTITTAQIATLVQMAQDLIYNDFSAWALEKWGCTSGNQIQKFDRAKSIILKLDSGIYMNVID